MKRKIFFVFLLLIFIFPLYSISNKTCMCNCFTIIAGKNATADGSVILAHNEDDGGDAYLNIMRVNAKKFNAPLYSYLKSGEKIQVSPSTQELIWFELPGFNFADSFINKSGVVIVSNGCMSKEKAQGEGIIGYMLRRLVVERAHTAREAVLLLGKFVEEYGYNSSGRTYSIADKNEGWMVAVVKGKHWVAERVDDDKVAIIPNHYNIHKINLKNTRKYLGSKDIIKFAIEKGLYNPEKDGAFDFAKVYAHNLKNTYNTYRQWSALRLIGGNKFQVEDIYPFEIKPARKVTPALLMRVLRDHFEGTKYDLSKKETSPNNPSTYGNKRPICVKTTRYSIVAQLRANLPAPISTLIWVSIGKPDTSVFLPLYYGLKSFPEDFSRKKPPLTYEEIIEKHYFPTKSFILRNKLIYSRIHLLENFVEKDYYNRIKVLKKYFSPLEDSILKTQKSFESTFVLLYGKDQKLAKNFLDFYFHGIYSSFEKSLKKIEKTFIKN